MKKILKVFLVFTLCFICVGCVNNKKIIGFDKEIDFSMNYSKIKSVVDSKIYKKKKDTYLAYENIKFLGKKSYAYFYFYNTNKKSYDDYFDWDEETAIPDDKNIFSQKGELKNIYLSSAYTDWKKQIKAITGEYGEPIHKENYNNNKKDSVVYVWNRGDVLLTLYGTVDRPEAINIKMKKSTYENTYKTVQNNIKKDKSLRKAYKYLVDLSSICGTPIINQIKDNNLKFKSESTYDDYYLVFRESKSFLGENVTVEYYYDNPYSGYGSYDSNNYIGKIRKIKLGSDSVKNKKEFIKKLEKLTANNMDKKGNIRKENGLPYYISGGFTNDEFEYEIIPDPFFCEIDSKFNNDSSLKKVNGYKDCDKKEIMAEECNIIDNNLPSYNGYYDEIKDDFSKRVKRVAKYPSSAIVDNVKISRIGEYFDIEADLTCKNAFGMASTHTANGSYKLNLDTNEIEFSTGLVDYSIIS